VEELSVFIMLVAVIVEERKYKNKPIVEKRF
jgi:hypothetical protein